MSLENQELIAALQAQTAMIGQLVVSNQQVIALLTDVVAGMVDEDGSDLLVPRYLDGSPAGGGECL